MNSRLTAGSSLVALAAAFLLGFFAPVSAQAPRGEKQVEAQAPELDARQVRKALDQPQAQLEKLSELERVSADQVAIVDIRQFVDGDEAVKKLTDQHADAIRKVRAGVRQDETLKTALEQSDRAAVSTVLALHVDRENGPVLIVRSVGSAPGGSGTSGSDDGTVGSR